MQSNRQEGKHDEQLRELVVEAERALARREFALATQLLAKAETITPEHPLILNARGMQKLHEGQLQAAKELAERAVARDATNPAFWINLATIQRALTAPEAEMQALERALALEPRHLLALLQKASLLELLERPRAAAKVYRAALQSVAPGTAVPPLLQKPLQRALAAVKANDAALEEHLAHKLEGLGAARGSAAQRRFDHCLDTFLGKRAIYRPQPTFMYFPSLPDWEFHDRDAFPWLEEFEASSQEVRREVEGVLRDEQSELVPYIAHADGLPLDQWAQLNRSRRWSAYFLWKEGSRIEAHIARCPVTSALLSRTPQVDIAGHGPNAFFSILDARTRIPPHTGETNARLIVHVPLVVPEGCGFRVGSETRQWRVGEAWVFDDTFEHEAWNESDRPRAILIFDVWNPHLTETERALVRSATQGIREFYDGESGRAPPA